MALRQTAAALTALLAAAFSVPACASTTTGGITLVEPDNGAVVVRGSAVNVRVEVEGSVNAASVHVWPSSRSVPKLNFTQAPYQGTLAIPADVVGNLKIETFAKSTSGALVRGPTVTITIVPGGQPVAIEATPRLIVELAGAPGSEGVSVKGTFADGAQFGVGGAAFGTTYLSSNPSIATVNADGVVTPVGLGLTYVTSTNGPHKAYTEVYVVEDALEALPTTDHSASVSVVKGALRLDPVSGRFAQKLVIRNVSSNPVPNPLVVVVTDLTTGVTIENSRGRTKQVSPIRSPFVRSKADKREFLAPGEETEAIVEFSNPEGRAVNYSTKVLSGVTL